MGQARHRSTAALGGLCALALAAGSQDALADGRNCAKLRYQRWCTRLGRYRPKRTCSFIIPISSEYQGYLNIKGYKDVEVANRANTWTTWVTFAISPAPPEPASAKAVSRKY